MVLSMVCWGQGGTRGSAVWSIPTCGSQTLNPQPINKPRVLGGCVLDGSCPSVVSPPSSGLVENQPGPPCPPAKDIGFPDVGGASIATQSALRGEGRREAEGRREYIQTRSLDPNPLEKIGAESELVRGSDLRKNHWGFQEHLSCERSIWGV